MYKVNGEQLVITMNKNDVFVKHIENHIKEMNPEQKKHGKVMCKVCLKDIDEIFKNENPCPRCGELMEYLEHKRYFRCHECHTDVAEDGTILSWKE